MTPAGHHLKKKSNGDPKRRPCRSTTPAEIPTPNRPTIAARAAHGHLDSAPAGTAHTRATNPHATPPARIRTQPQPCTPSDGAPLKRERSARGSRPITGIIPIPRSGGTPGKPKPPSPHDPSHSDHAQAVFGPSAYYPPNRPLKPLPNLLLSPASVPTPARRRNAASPQQGCPRLRNSGLSGSPPLPSDWCSPGSVPQIPRSNRASAGRLMGKSHRATAPPPAQAAQANPHPRS